MTGVGRPAPPERSIVSAFRRTAALAVVLVATLAATASAENGPPPPGPGTPPPGQPGQQPVAGQMQIDVVAVHPDVSGVTVVLHCVPAEFAGKKVMLTVGAEVDLALLAPGARLMAIVDVQAGVLVKVKPIPAGGACGPGAPGPGQPGSGEPKPGQPGPGQPGADGPGDDKGGVEFRADFINRVWKFRGSSSGFEAGVLNITVEKVVNLPKKFRDQDDELIDQDAYVLIGAKVKVVDAEGKRVPQSALEDADQVQVEGKLLPTAKWRDDEDGTSVTTIRAKRLRIVS
jgi:hypothetical protein